MFQNASAPMSSLLQASPINSCIPFLLMYSFPPHVFQGCPSIMLFSKRNALKGDQALLQPYRKCNLAWRKKWKDSESCMQGNFYNPFLLRRGNQRWTLSVKCFRKETIQRNSYFFFSFLSSLFYSQENPKG